MKKTTLLVAIVIALSNTLSAQWTTISTPITGKLQTVVFTSPTNGFTAGAFQYMHKTTDGGSTWTSGGNYDAIDLYFFDANNGYGSSVVGSSMKKTTNGGTTWTPITPPNSSSMWGTFATSATTCYFIATDNKIHKSVNSGSSFTTVTISGANYFTDIWFTDANTGYISSQGGIIYKTTNAGGSWSVNYTINPPGTQLLSIYFVNTNLGFACGTGGTILRTTNAGASWTALTTGSTAILSGIRFFDAINGIAVGYGGTILRTVDGGNSWVADASNTTKWLYSISYTGTASSAVIVGDSGAVLKNTNIPSGINDLQTAAVKEINCFPNPANDFTMLNIVATSNGQVSPQLFDVNGSFVKSFTAINLIPGENAIRLDIADLASGIYFLHVNSGAAFIEKKIVVVRMD
jgi:photosystem II stability/assembly factor-like uncharacterized protein